MKLQFAFLLFACLYALTECNHYIYILGLIPHIDYLESQSSIKLTELATREINARVDLLPGYELKIYWKDTNCSSGKSVYEFFRSSVWYNHPVDFVAVFGLPCLHTTSAIAEVIPLYGQLMFTHSAYLPDFASYAYIVNGFPTGLNAIAAQLKFIKDHNWHRVAVINFESLYFSNLGYELQKGFYKLNISNSVHSVSSTLSEIEYEAQIKALISSIDAEGYRVVVFNMFLEEAEDILCQMSKMSINFDKYSLLLPGFIEFDENNQDSIKCNLKEAIAGAIGFIEHPRVEDILEMNIPTINGDKPYNIIQHIPGARDTLWETLGPFMYDSMWSLAFGLKETLNAGHDPYPYPNSSFRGDLYENILKQSFRSLTGDVFYHNKLRVSPTAQLVEFTPDGTKFRGLYINLPYNTSQIDNLTGVTLINNISFRYWDEERTDGVEDHHSSFYIFLSITVLSGLAVVYITVLISVILFCVYKGYPPAVKSEPIMSILILASNVLLLAMAVLLTIDGKFYPLKGNTIECTIYCHLLVWLGSVSTSLILGGVLAKSLKLYAFWVLKKFQKNYKRLLRFRFLVLIPLTLAMIDTIIISLWAVFSRIPYVTQIVRSNVKDPPFYRTAFCAFSTDIPLFVLISIKVVVIIISIFLAYNLRKVTNKSGRYTFVISLIVYSTLFFCLFIVFIIGYVSNLDSMIGLASSFCILSAISTATIIGLPILYYMYRDPRGEKFFKPLNNDTITEDTDMLHRRIKALQNDLEHMRLQHEEEKKPNKKMPSVYVNADAIESNFQWHELREMPN